MAVGKCVLEHLWLKNFQINLRLDKTEFRVY